jgi:hypothetical protein
MVIFNSYVSLPEGNPPKKKDSPYKVFGKEYRGAKMLKLTMARKASCNENPRE